MYYYFNFSNSSFLIKMCGYVVIMVIKKIIKY